MITSGRHSAFVVGVVVGVVGFWLYQRMREGGA